MYKFKVTIKHDKGVVGVICTASSKQSAIDMVVLAENCPVSAIQEVTTLKKL